MKYAGWIIFCLFFGLKSNAQDTVKINKNKYSLLWQIEGNGLKEPSFLFGTMHLEDKRIFEFPDEFLTYFEKAKTIAFELNLDSIYIQEIKNGYTYLEENFIARGNNTDDSVKNYKIAFNPASTSENTFFNIQGGLFGSKNADKMPVFLDAYLFHKAKVQGKKLIGLEKYDQQRKALSNYHSSSRQKYFYSKEKLDSANKSKDKMRIMYTAGDLPAIQRFMSKSDTTFVRIVIDERNVGMVKNMIPLMEEHSSFVAVGAGHLYGKNGMLQLLKDEGYTVTQVPSTFSNKRSLEQFQDATNEYNWVSYLDDKQGFEVSFPFTPFAYTLPYSKTPLLACTDYVTGTSYEAFSFKVDSINDAEYFDVVRQYMEVMESSFTYKKVDLRIIDSEGIKMIESSFEKEGYRYKLRSFYYHGRMYFFFSYVETKRESEKDQNTFLNSIHLLDSVKLNNSESGPYLQHSVLGGYRINFPKKPYIETFEDEDSYIVATTNTLNSYYDLNKGATYTVRWFDELDESTDYTDSLNVHYFFESVLDGNYAFRKDSIVQKNGLNYNTYALDSPVAIDGSNVNAKIIVRGNRLYLLHGTYIEERDSLAIQEFLDSFHLEPYDKTDYLKQEIEEVSLFTGDSLKVIRQDSERALVEEGIEYRFYGSINPKNGVTQTLRVKSYSELYRKKSVELWLQELDSLILEGMDSLVAQKQLFQTDSTFGKSYLFESIGQDKQIYKEIRFKNNKYYSHTITCPPSSLEYELKNRVMKIADLEYSGSSIFSKKEETILSQLKGVDSLDYLKAKHALTYYEFDSTDVEVLKSIALIPVPVPDTIQLNTENKKEDLNLFMNSILAEEYTDDSPSFYFESLLVPVSSALRNLNSHSSYEALRWLYNMNDSSALNLDLFYNLSLHKNYSAKEAFTLFLSKPFATNFEQDYAIHDYLEELYMEDEEFFDSQLPIIFKKYKHYSLEEDSLFQSEPLIYQLELIHTLTYLHKDMAFFTKHQRSLQTFLRVAYSNILTYYCYKDKNILPADGPLMGIEYNLEEYLYCIVYLTNLLDQFVLYDSINLYDFNSVPRLLKEKLLFQTNHGFDLNPKELKIVLESDYGKEIIDVFNKKGQLKLIPKTMLTPVLVGEHVARAYAWKENLVLEEIEDIVFLEKVKLGKSIYYFYELTQDYEEDIIIMVKNLKVKPKGIDFDVVEMDFAIRQDKMIKAVIEELIQNQKDKTK